MRSEGDILSPDMNLRRLLLLTILAPSTFVVGVVVLSYLSHQAGFLTHGGEHLLLAVIMVTGIIPFSFFAHHIFRRIEKHILPQNRTTEESLELDQVLRSASKAVLEATGGEAAEVRLVAQGKTNREIGEKLFISESTAKYHLRNILDKLHLENRAQVVAYATRRGLDRRNDDPERS